MLGYDQVTEIFTFDNNMDDIVLKYETISLLLLVFKGLIWKQTLSVAGLVFWVYFILNCSLSPIEVEIKHMYALQAVVVLVSDLVLAE